MNNINTISKSLDAKSKNRAETNPPIINNTRYLKRLAMVSNRGTVGTVGILFTV
jgi:hypothetical protein